MRIDNRKEQQRFKKMMSHTDTNSSQYEEQKFCEL
jgi:hypothetical protein